MALQALSLYGAVTYAKSGAASTVALRSGGDFQQDFQVDPSNRLLLQRVPLPQVPGQYNVEVSGEGCVYLQVRVVGTGGILGGESLARQERGEDRIIESSRLEKTLRSLIPSIEVEESKEQEGGEKWKAAGKGKRRRRVEVHGRERVGEKEGRLCSVEELGEWENWGGWVGRGSPLSHVERAHTLTQSCWLSPRQA